MTMNNSCHYNEKRLSLQREKGITRNYSALSKLFEKTGDTPFVISYPSINETRILKANSHRQKSHAAKSITVNFQHFFAKKMPWSVTKTLSELLTLTTVILRATVERIHESRKKRNYCTYKWRFSLIPR